MNDAFKSCDALIAAAAAGDTSKATIKVPASAVDAYKTADGWSQFASIIVAQ